MSYDFLSLVPLPAGKARARDDVEHEDDIPVQSPMSNLTKISYSSLA